MSVDSQLVDCNHDNTELLGIAVRLTRTQVEWVPLNLSMGYAGYAFCPEIVGGAFQ